MSMTHSWGDQVQLPDVLVNDVAAAAADAVNTADDVPLNNADPVNDVRVNPAGSVNDVRGNLDDVNAVANAVQDADALQILRVETPLVRNPVRTLVTLVSW